MSLHGVIRIITRFSFKDPGGNVSILENMELEEFFTPDKEVESSRRGVILNQLDWEAANLGNEHL